MDVQKARQVLKEAGYVMHFWHRDDIIQRAEEKEIELTEKQIDDVMSLLEHKTDCNIGINWEMIDVWIYEVIE